MKKNWYIQTIKKNKIGSFYYPLCDICYQIVLLKPKIRELRNLLEFAILNYNIKQAVKAPEQFDAPGIILQQFA